MSAFAVFSFNLFSIIANLGKVDDQKEGLENGGVDKEDAKDRSFQSVQNDLVNEEKDVPDSDSINNEEFTKLTINNDKEGKDILQAAIFMIKIEICVDFNPKTLFHKT